jgi:hypothetical protein
VILESASPLAHRMLVLKDPPRLVLDLDDADLPAATIAALSHADPHDPHLAGIRVGHQAGNALRIVMVSRPTSIRRSSRSRRSPSTAGASSSTSIRPRPSIR